MRASASGWMPWCVSRGRPPGRWRPSRCRSQPADRRRLRAPAPPDLPPAGSSLVQIFPSGPQSSSRHIEQLLLAAIYSARREVVLTTPYFIPSEALLTALRSAAMRGVRVVLIVPARVDSMLVRYAGNAYFNDLLAAGVEVLCFGDGLLHTKSMVIDGEVTIFWDGQPGSAQFRAQLRGLADRV
ncbi:phospholipase D-like domain-containing protein [Candidatus Skiveiella danica]|uniref:phospholipase D-like domain-containing protein n=1 Tax=Candidatus Skiveiella danica TaxID=3386177 RepID=UPI0039B94A66